LSASEIPGVEARALFAAVDGSIGIVATLPQEKFRVLEKVEKKMEENEISLGNLDHAKYCISNRSNVDGVHSRTDGRRRRGQRDLLMGISWRGFWI
jgi:CPSF A subunit region